MIEAYFVASPSEMGNKPLYLIVGWDDAARQAVKSLLALGMDEDDDVRVAPGDVLMLLGGRTQLSALLRRAE